MCHHRRLPRQRRGGRAYVWNAPERGVPSGPAPSPVLWLCEGCRGEDGDKISRQRDGSCAITAGCRASGEAVGHMYGIPLKGAFRPDRPHPLFYGFVKAAMEKT